MDRPHFTLIGLSDSSDPTLSEEALRAISSAKVFSGGLRHRNIVEHLLPEGADWINITPPLSKLYPLYRRAGSVVIFASGDPLFFGFAVTLQRDMPYADLTIIPTFHSLQRLAHRAELPYHAMRHVSLTGRTWHEFHSALRAEEEMIGVLTDSRLHTPSIIAREMLEWGFNNYRMWLGSHLGNAELERVRELSLESLTADDDVNPSCLILLRRRRLGLRIGIPESLFVKLDGRERMITKMPVRLLSLSYLALAPGECLWDVGFCTGSVSIEALRFQPALHVESFEIRPECEAILLENAHRFHAPGIRHHMGDFLSADLSEIPSPDAVFIGGHGGHLAEIMTRVVSRLREQGRIVFNASTPQNASLFESILPSLGLELVKRTTLQVDAHNRIEVMLAGRFSSKG